MSRPIDSAELARRQSAMLRFGRIVECNPVTARARVLFEEGHTSGWLRWLASAAGPGETAWHVPNLNEEVVVLAPDGALETGVILRGLYGLEDKAPFSADPNLSGHLHSDGGFDTYDTQTHERRVHLPEGGVAIVEVESTRFEVRDGQIKAQVGDTSLLIEDGKVTIDAASIVLNGQVDLGGEGGQPVARKTDPVSGGVISDGSSSVRSV